MPPRAEAPNACCGKRSSRAARLLRLFTGIDDGVKFLIDLRADELRLASDPAIAADDATALADLDQELKAQLATLFDAGLLGLRRITWNAPAALLEKLIEYEAVHAIESWADLKNRLDSDRRCYAFFHPAMANEPLVFVEIALTTGIPGELAPLLDAQAPELDPDHADTAVFYSISNCQPGLAGVNLGTALIKQVVEELRHDLPQLHRFVTLSPIPGYRAWLDTTLHEGDLRAHERELLPAAPDRVVARLADPTGTPTRPSVPRSSPSAPATSRRSISAACSIPSRTSTSPTGPSWSASTGSPTRARSDESNRPRSWSTTCTNPITSRPAPRPTWDAVRSRCRARYESSWRSPGTNFPPWRS